MLSRRKEQSENKYLFRAVDVLTSKILKLPTPSTLQPDFICSLFSRSSSSSESQQFASTVQLSCPKIVSRNASSPQLKQWQIRRTYMNECFKGFCCPWVAHWPSFPQFLPPNPPASYLKKISQQPAWILTLTSPWFLAFQARHLTDACLSLAVAKRRWSNFYQENNDAVVDDVHSVYHWSHHFPELRDPPYDVWNRKERKYGYLGRNRKLTCTLWIMENVLCSDLFQTVSSHPLILPAVGNRDGKKKNQKANSRQSQAKSLVRWRSGGCRLEANKHPLLHQEYEANVGCC